LGIAFDSPEVVTKYIGSLHSYLRHSLLLFEPTTIDSASVKAIHLENKGKNERDDHFKKPPFKPPNCKPKVKGKGKEKRTTSTKKYKEKDLIAITAKRKVMTMIIVGNSTRKGDQRSMEEKTSRRQ